MGHADIHFKVLTIATYLSRDVTSQQTSSMFIPQDSFKKKEVGTPPSSTPLKKKEFLRGERGDQKKKREGEGEGDQKKKGEGEGGEEGPKKRKREEGGGTEKKGRGEGPHKKGGGRTPQKKGGGTSSKKKG